EGLYYGVPLILFPQTPEQDAVARRTEELGAGLRLSSISKDDILKAVERVLGEESFRQSAEKVSESFKNSGGIAEAVSFIESVGRR
ncbi:MAG: glucosyltransferase, partial [Firmicutes bacterium]|nr:glucosyltransferase [Bacillota bacterium]